MTSQISFSRLLVEKLPQHAKYKSEITAVNRDDGKKRIQRSFKRAEELKKILKKKYTEEVEIWKEKETERLRSKKEEEEKAKLQQQEKEFAEQRELERRKQLEQQKRDENAKNSLPPIIPSAPPPEPEDHGIPPNLATAFNTYPNLTDDSSHIQTSEIERTIPDIDRSTKPTWLDPGLRTVNVPRELMRKFIDIASPNTRQNRETCGLLAGKLSRNAFHITHLIIPKQTSTSDSCTTLNEEEIFTYQDSHNLITLGWIHTHPSQTAFMSSIDLHTHCSYQLMLPEAVAIVCAPKHSQTGMYSLTIDYGLKFIAACKQEGFHPHPKEPPIYEECGHISLDETLSIVVSDLR